MRHFLFLIITFLHLNMISLRAIFDGHFFHAGFFWNEPRFERNRLQTYSFDLAGDTTMKSRNGQGTIVPLFDLYGFHNMRSLAQNVPDLNPNNQFDEILINLADLPPRDCFGFVSFDGLFKMMRFEFKYYQNIGEHFFLGLELPIFEFSINPGQPFDLSPRNNRMPNANTPEWQSFLRSFDGILQNFGLEIGPTLTTDLGDTILAAGYTSNYDDHWYLDLIDIMFTVVGLIPTGRQTNPQKPFDIPNGYNGHFGIGGSFDSAIGIWDWATLGMHADYLNLFVNNKEIRIKTALEQTGLIKLVKTTARINPGNIWRFGPYFKADHVLAGLSWIFGYTYERKNRNVITSCCPNCNLDIANSDSTLAGFSQHTFHIIVEYDASSDTTKIGPRVAFFFNHSIFGRHIFDTNVKGGYLGLDVIWNF